MFGEDRGISSPFYLYILNIKFMGSYINLYFIKGWPDLFGELTYMTELKRDIKRKFGLEDENVKFLWAQMKLNHPKLISI